MIVFNQHVSELRRSKQTWWHLTGWGSPPIPEESGVFSVETNDTALE